MNNQATQWKVLHKLGQAVTVTGYTSAGVVLTVLLAGFVPPMEGQEVRRPVAKKIATLRPEDYPLPIVQNAQGSAIRGVVMKNNYATLATDAQGISSRSPVLHAKAERTWMEFLPQSVVLNTQSGQQNLEHTASTLSLVLAEEAYSFEHTNPLLTTQPMAFGEALTHGGLPLRWQHSSAPHAKQNSVDFDPMCALQRPTMEALQTKLLARAYAPGSGETYLGMARRYKSIVNKVAKRYKLRPSLIYAIIHTESNFRPRLTSAASAMGLMQILPSTAGGEVHKYLYGHNAVITHEDLEQPEINITFGATYFHLLMTQHLHGIVQHRSREICAIAAYNMGIGRLMRYFGATPEAAFARINSLTPQQVFQHLTEILPIPETRTYISRVSHRESFYTSL